MPPKPTALEIILQHLVPILLGCVGFYMIAHYHSWELALGIFLVLIGNNIEQARRFKKIK